MPFYSIHIAGGKDPEGRAREVKDALRGKDADYTGSRNYFYVQNHRKTAAELEGLVIGMADDDNEVSVQKIKGGEYHWEKSQR